MRTLIAAGAATFLIGGLICVGFVLWWLGQPTHCSSYAPLTSQITDPTNLPTISLCPGSDESPTLYLIVGHSPALRSERSLGSLSGAAEFSCRAPGNFYPSHYRPRGLVLKRHVLHQPKFTTYGSDTAGCRLDALGDDLDELLSYLDA